MMRFPFIEISGNEYELGMNFGKIFKADITENVKQAEQEMQDPSIQADFKIVKKKLETDFSQQLEHIYGRADGAGVDRDLYLLFLCYELWEDRNIDRCSDIIVKQDNQIIMGHNEDGPYTQQNSAFIKYNVDNGYYFDYSTPDALPGASFGFNSHGLVYSMNYMYIENMKRTSIPVWFVMRPIVECKNFQEIKEKLSNFETASGFHLNIFSEGKAYSIEGLFDKVEIKEIEDIFIHTNHYINETFDTGYTPPDSNTLFRLTKIRELLRRKKDKKLTVSDIEEILSYRGESYYNSILSEADMERNMTACTIIFNSEDKTYNLINRLEKKQHVFHL